MGALQRLPSKLKRVNPRFQCGRLGALLCASLLACAPATIAQGSSGNSPQPSSAGGVSGGSAPKKAASTPDPKPCSVIPDPDPCGSSPNAPASSAAPNALDKFPFPGSSADSSGAPSLGVPDAPAAPSQGNGQPAVTSPSDTEKKFPFPGASPAPAAPPGPTARDAAGASSSSSSSSDGAESELPDTNAPGLKDAGSEGTQSRPGGHILHRAAPAAPKAPTADEREAEDLDVAKFYLDSGDLAGALLRAEDAVKTMPDDPDAHFALAEIAAKLGKKDQAIAEYHAVLNLDASGKQKKDSTRALAKLAK